MRLRSIFIAFILSIISAKADAMRHVVLVHGIHDTGDGLRCLAKFLASKGCVVHSFTYTPSNGSVGLDVLAGQLATFVKQELPPADKCDLIAFSMGGLIARAYIQDLGGARRTRSFVSISAPNHGTLLAHLLWNPAGRQMRPDSAFLTHLNSNLASYHDIPSLTIRTPYDLAIIPSTSTELSFANNIEVAVALHPLMVFSGRVNRTVLDFLHQVKFAKLP
jgi:triacylglycerol lipase